MFVYTNWNIYIFKMIKKWLFFLKHKLIKEIIILIGFYVWEIGFLFFSLRFSENCPIPKRIKLEIVSFVCFFFSCFAHVSIIWFFSLVDQKFVYSIYCVFLFVVSIKPRHFCVSPFVLGFVFRLFYFLFFISFFNRVPSVF